MTPEERAWAVVDELTRWPDGDQLPIAVDPFDANAAQSLIAAAIWEAVAEEREACAKAAQYIADTVPVGPGGDCSQGCIGVAEQIAAAIRARATPADPPAVVHTRTADLDITVEGGR
jgi:hypothetical protein